MTDLPELTILLGPQTRVAYAVNAFLRENRSYLGNRGIKALPSRLASPIVRRAVDERPVEMRRAEFAEAVADGPTVLAAIHTFGPPQTGLVRGELFPDAEHSIAGLGPVAGQARYILAIDPLPEFFIAAASEPLEEKARRTPWEMLYELSWFELISGLVELLPEASFLVLSGRRVGARPQALETSLVGVMDEPLPSPYALLRHMISETGIAVLDRMLANGEPDAAMLADLYASFALTSSMQERRERLGIDKVTGILLEQRFEEDLLAIEALPRVEVF
ncbi:MAG: hypothetical protein AAFY31_00395 [Pseudomonadota bacterium]